MDKLRVLMVDDDAELGVMLKLMLAREAPAFSIHYVEGGQECLDYLKSNPVDCILSDYQMPDMDGMELLAALRSRGNTIPFIFLTGQGNEEVAREAFKNGADDYFTKDIGFAHFTRIMNSVEQAVGHRIAEAKRRQAEEALQDREEQFRTLFESADDGIFLLDGAVFADCNSRAVELYGYKDKEDIIGHSPLEFSPPVQPDGSDSAVKAQGFITDALNGVPQRFYWQSRRGDGSLIYVEISLNSLSLKGKNYVQAIVRDITDRKKVEDALRASQNFLETIIENEPECVKLIAPDGTLTLMNRAGLDMIEAGSLEEVKGKQILGLVAPEYREAFRKLNKTVFEGGSGKLEFEMIGFKGRRLRLDTRAVPLRNERDEIIALLGVTRDVTERTRMEDALKDSESRYRSFVAHSSESIWRIELDKPVPVSLPEDEQMKLIFESAYLAEINDTGGRMLGVDRNEDVIGVRLHDLVAPDDPGNVELVRKFIRAGYRLMESEVHIRDVHGEPVSIYSNASGEVKDGKLVRAWGVSSGNVQTS